MLSGDEIPSAVSFGSYMMIPKGHYLVVSFHGNTVSHLLAHLKRHLQRYRLKYDSSNDKVHLKIIFPILPTEKVKINIFPFLGKNTLYEDVPREAVVVVERPLPNLKANI